MLPKHLKLYHHRKHSRKHLPTVIEDLCHQFSLEDLRKSTNNFDLKLRTDVNSKVYKGDHQLSHVHTSRVGKMLVNYSKQHTPKKHYPTIIEELCHHFSLDDLMKSTDNFDESYIIRTSIFSIAYKGYLKHNGSTDYPIALKRMKSISHQWKFKKEIEFNCQLHHPNLASFIGFSDHKVEKILVYEYMSNGSLYDQLRFRDMKPLPWKKRLEICIGAAKGLHYLHTRARRTIFHCDIKPQTILLDDNMIPKLSHLGFSLQGPLFKSKPKPIKVDNFIGPNVYMAPEYVQTNTFTDKCDVYSFGVVLLEIACTNYKQTIFDKMIMLEHPDLYFQKPLNLINLANFLERFKADEIIDPILMTEIAPECLAVFMDVTKRCLNVEPNERPIIGEVEVELEQALALQVEADAMKRAEADFSAVVCGAKILSTDYMIN